jgi:phasin family protein
MTITTESIMTATALARPAVSRDVDTTAAFELSAKAVAGLEKVVELNLQTGRTFLSEQKALADAAIFPQSFDEVVDLQFQQFPATLKKTFAYWRHVEEIALETHNDFASVLHDSLQRGLAMVQALVDNAAPTASAAVDTARLVGAQASPASNGVPVAIVDSDGNVVSSGKSGRDLH